MRRTLLSLTTCLTLAFAPAAGAHELSPPTAKDEADDVAGFVAGVLSTEYDVHRFGVVDWESRSEHKVVCDARWNVAEPKTRKRWSCTAQIVVWLEDHDADEPDWDYRRIRCTRGWP